MAATRNPLSARAQINLGPATLAPAHLAHVTLLRKARTHHRAISQELRTFYEAVAAETVPAVFFELLRDRDEAQ